MRIEVGGAGGAQWLLQRLLFRAEEQTMWTKKEGRESEPLVVAVPVAIVPSSTLLYLTAEEGVDILTD